MNLFNKKKTKKYIISFSFFWSTKLRYLFFSFLGGHTSFLRSNSIPESGISCYRSVSSYPFFFYHPKKLLLYSNALQNRKINIALALMIIQNKCQNNAIGDKRFLLCWLENSPTTFEKSNTTICFICSSNDIHILLKLIEKF